METWLFYALLATFFAGATAVIAKFGLGEVRADFGLAVRTIAVFVLVWLLVFAQRGWSDWQKLTPRALGFLLLSGVTTALSWVCYYRAIKLGPVSIVAAIDKGSILVTLLLSFWLLREPATPKVLLGAGLILAGLVVLAVR
ncbi:MAG: EamA family transporter [Saprospiraceae bacterium]|nr:EamA family transporter [Saprospiraceae bacterium]